MDNIRKCPHCGAEMDAADRFCPLCGKAAQPENMVVCEKCGQLNEAGNRFCMACGEPLGAFNEALSFEDDFTTGGDPAANPYEALEDSVQDAYDELDNLTDDDLFGVDEPEPVPEPPRKEEPAKEQPKSEPVKEEKPRKEKPQTEKPQTEKTQKEKAEKPPKKKKGGVSAVLIILLVLVVAAVAAYFFLPEEMLGKLGIGRTSDESGMIVENTPVPTDVPAEQPTDESAEESAEQPTDEPTEEPTAEPTAEPTVEPAAEPTAEPTVEPAAEIQMPTGPAIEVPNPPAGSYVQAMTRLNVMDGPGEEFASVGTISAGGIADYLGRMMIASDGEGWYLVNLNGTEGWLSANFTQLMD